MSLATAAAPPAWAGDLFRSPLSAALLDPESGAAVWSVTGDASTAQISEQFKANAGAYEARYAASAHFEALYRQAMLKTGLSIPAGALVLDIGTGSGANSVVPCMNLFQAARYVATDLSGELLSLMADYAVRNGVTGSVIPVIMDAMSDHLRHGRFDVVTGSAILHHLEVPRRGLEAAARALKPGGHAIFMEPFDGYGLVRLAFERILAEAELRRSPLEPPVEKALRALVIDIAARTDPDTTAPDFVHMDDKWLFSRDGIEAYAAEAGFSQVQLVPHNDNPRLYRNMAGVQIRLASGMSGLQLPDWAVDILDSFDRAITRAGKRSMMLEASIVLTK